ncbi:CAP domain-containing protein [Flavobacterium sp. JAS]|uniref:CAP domain-containing protein n=1 Tax=Flavobacterium sp. JAS TaxID=2897329 RepID=UPI001E469359|nr:CAP domain-containing protein [Flavobacterium sp. JAS]MCD0468615.1 CAP domain-containing protein [Flavobacterium sp. JAS]
MKKIMRTMLFIVTLVTMNACSADTAEGKENNTSTEKAVTSYTYNDSELETMQLINNYRVSIGLNALEKINHISYECEEHNKYMIETNTVNHDGFVSRSNDIMTVLGAKFVGENVAYNYRTSDAVLKAWLESPGHKENIEGNYTHFGISVTIDPKTGYKYYTNIFARM